MLKETLDAAALLREFPRVLDRLEAAEGKIANLERALSGPPCPHCNQPGWHEESNAPTRSIGSEFGLRDVTWACLRCGYKKIEAPS